MKIYVNGKEKLLGTETKTIMTLIESYGLNPKVVIVERNKDIVAKENYVSTILEKGDYIELVHFVGGG
ncbi:sulfur carrier protein ThiS [Robertmurraya korlensis]|uniref:sulfur carrier protein ThiS n=1 Tax=Robertmurraya korlensis TaxID=519977 RepID=UPI00203A4A7E|nr:sulfur carrier protein ThiS [Robertmurraya korlensis]MCM3601362.1 sulfur carrier protein ThiS [Robertmurraya korlensis]